MLCETSADQNLAVRLDRDRKDASICVRVERVRQSGRGIEPGDIVARLPADDAEPAAR